MKALSEFYDQLLPELPGIAPGLVDLHLLAIAREYLTETKAWQDTVTLTLPDNADATALFSPEAKTIVVAPLQLEVAGQLWWQALEPRRVPFADSNTQRRVRFLAHQPPFSFNAAGDTITFSTRPDGEVALLLAMAPSSKATQLPDFLLEGDHLEAIRTGTLSRLMRMGGKPWTNLASAVDYDSDYSAYKLAPPAGNTRVLLRTAKTTI